MDDGSKPGETLTARPLVTAYEAFPELERLFLGATTEIWAGFRIFDLRTKLRSPEGRAVGESWFDLIVHRLRAGVRIHFLLADFDPALATPLHRGTWRSVRQFCAAREMAGGAGLDLLATRHGARAGLAPRGLFWPGVLAKIRGQIQALRELEEAERREALSLAVGLRPWIRDPLAGGFAFRLCPVPHIHPATHHQKLAVFDRRALFIGGLDLDERRYDDPRHDRPAEETWHDVSVVTEAPDCVAAAQAHLEAMLGGQPPPPPQSRGNPRLVRTVSRAGSANPFRLSPRPMIRESEAEHFRIFAAARQLIFIETQYFRHRPLARALARAARRNRDLQLIMMLPAAPEEVAFESRPGLDSRFGEYLQARCVRKVKSAFGPRAFIGMPLRPVPSRSASRDTALGSDIVYIHAKVTVADDRAGLVGSANLNGRSMRWDTEAGVVFDDAPTVAHLRRRLFEHWLPPDAPAAAYDLATARAAWSEIARENTRRPPRERRGFIVPYNVRPAEEFGQPVPGVPEELV
ncbi:phospholipase D family protein [Amaricoccus solimangrovi]|uniref:Phospholipase D n=1 Tax=Amaricoccus solimangrovi TaxID=2589815 RepID=A0A501X0H3_9RHOB|nr:phospholipase D-like domain-containing protein [Amaricoccus solimangrovi]TPE52226.1 phospholipase [Amaricoccus solimangrovi]